MTSVLVTRLMPFAASAIESLEEKGYDVTHESLLSVEPLYYRCPELPQSGKTIIALTSRVTLEILSSRKDEVEDLLDLPCYCVGDKTADDARKFGFKDVISADGNGHDLAELIMESELFKNPVLHIGAEDISTDPQAFLKSEGWDVIHWPIYKAIETEDLSEHVLQDLKEGGLDAILLYSVRAAQIFEKLIKRYELEDHCKDLIAIVISKRVSSELENLNLKKVVIADFPTELDLIDAVIQTIPTEGANHDILRARNANG